MLDDDAWMSPDASSSEAAAQNVEAFSFQVPEHLFLFVYILFLRFFVFYLLLSL